jgi:uncharacterized protein YdhG (YjbR/CyaY superfamily)
MNGTCCNAPGQKSEITMKRPAAESVPAYIAQHPAAAAATLRLVRRTIREALPDADEVISYRIPAYRLHGTTAIYFAGWKHHYSVYPASAALVAALKHALAPYEVSKGTIRFPLAEPVPVKLIGRIAKLRAKEAAGRARAKAPKR